MGHNDMAQRIALFQKIDEHFGGVGPDETGRLAHRGKLGVKEFGDIDIVKAHDLDLAGHGKS